MAASLAQLRKIAATVECYKAVHASYLAVKADWFHHLTQHYPAMSTNAILLTWTTTFPLRTTLRAILFAKCQIFRYFFMYKRKNESQWHEVRFEENQTSLREEQEKFKGIIRRLMFELANVDATVRALSSTKEMFPTFVDVMASLPCQEDVAGAIGTLAATFLHKTSRSQCEDLRRYPNEARKQS